jgi:hypothetical protein
MPNFLRRLLDRFFRPGIPAGRAPGRNHYYIAYWIRKSAR